MSGRRFLCPSICYRKRNWGRRKQSTGWSVCKWQTEHWCGLLAITCSEIGENFCRRSEIKAHRSEFSLFDVDHGGSEYDGTVDLGCLWRSRTRLIGRERERERERKKIQCEERKREENRIKQCRKVGHRVFNLQLASVTISSRLKKRTLIKVNFPCESKQRMCKYSACPHHACINKETS